MNPAYHLFVFAIAFAAVGSSSYGQSFHPETLFITGRPVDDLGFAGDNIAFMYNFALSPDGNWWVGEFELDNALDVVVLRGLGSDQPEVVWAEHDPVPGFSGEEFRPIFDDRPNAIDDDGNVVGLARRNLAGVNRPLVYKFDGTELNVIATEEFGVPALPLTYGNQFHSPNVTSEGAAAFVAESLVGAIPGEDQVSLFEDGLFVGQRNGTTSYVGESLADFNDGRFFTNNDFFLFDGNTNGVGASNEIVVVGDIGIDGTVVLQEDTTAIKLPNGTTELFDRADQVFLAGNNDWYVLGDTNGVNGATEVAIRNCEVLVAEGDPSPDGFEYDQPIALSGDANGNYVWIWETTNPDLDRDTVLVYNGDQLLLSEGDTIMLDYDNDGVDEPAVIEFLNLEARNVAVGGGYVYLMVEIDEPGTTIFLGNAFIRFPVFILGDINQDGEVNLLDVQPFVTLLTNNEFQIEADTNQDGEVNLLDISQFVDLLSRG